MADITMCSDVECKMKDTCYRFTATPCMFRQAYFVGSPKVSDKECEYYWSTSNEKT
jgi:hypothetical protein